MKVKIHGLKNLNDAQQSKIILSLNGGGAVIDSILWERSMLNQRFTESRGKTPKDVIELIRSGTDHPTKRLNDYVLDFDIEGFFTYKGTVGYTYVGGVKQWINRRFLDTFDEAEVFGHLMHEYAHKALHFVHRGRKSTSVPYVAGYVTRDCYREYYKQKKLLYGLSNSFIYELAD